jgi:hypothetical protein
MQLLQRYSKLPVFFQIPGKIVVYSQPWFGDYGSQSPYRGSGAVEAAKYGAVATLIRSATQFSIDSPHTGILVSHIIYL